MKPKIHVFLVFPCLFHDLTNVGNLISGSSAFSKSSWNIWKFSVHILVKPCLENFEHYFASMWDECNCLVVWAFFGIAFLWDWNENWPFPVPWPATLGYLFACSACSFAFQAAGNDSDFYSCFGRIKHHWPCREHQQAARKQEHVRWDQRQPSQALIVGSERSVQEASMSRGFWHLIFPRSRTACPSRKLRQLKIVIPPAPSPPL